MLTVFDVAKYILEQGLPNMTHKKLQKLCYYVQAWSLAIQGIRMMDCEFQAWVHGPVCRELYDCCKRELYEAIDKAEQTELDEPVTYFINLVLEMYGNFTGDQLETMTHAEPPWKEARRGLRYWEPSMNTISEDLMASYYLEELEQAMKANKEQ